MSRALMGSEKLSQLRTVILSSFLHNSLCKTSDYFKQQAFGHRRFSYKYSRLLALPCAENHIFLDHVVISTVFQIIGTFTTPRTQTHHQQDCDRPVLTGLFLPQFQNSVYLRSPRCLAQHFWPRLAAFLPGLHQACCCLPLLFRLLIIVDWIKVSTFESV